MSTVVAETITSTEMLKVEEKPSSKLVRTSSIGKIKELNNYICSQHYYIILPLINWIRSSQNGLEKTLEKTITIYRHILFNSIIYRIFNIRQICKDCFNYSKSVVIPNIQNKFDKCVDSGIFLKIGVYSTISLVSFELLMCIYLLFSSYVPIGLTFLIVCIVSAVFIFYESIKVDFYVQEKRN